MKKKRKTIKEKITIGKFKIDIPKMYSIADYIPYNPNRDLKKWCIEMAIAWNEDNLSKPKMLEQRAQMIYDWVIK